MWHWGRGWQTEYCVIFAVVRCKKIKRKLFFFKKIKFHSLLTKISLEIISSNPSSSCSLLLTLRWQNMNKRFSHMIQEKYPSLPSHISSLHYINVWSYIIITWSVLEALNIFSPWNIIIQLAHGVLLRFSIYQSRWRGWSLREKRRGYLQREDINNVISTAWIQRNNNCFELREEDSYG